MDLQYLQDLKFKIMNLIGRFRAKTPAFWVKVRNIAASVFTGATAVWTANNEMGLNLDQIILSICKYLIAIGAAVGLTAQMTTEDDNDKVD